MKQMLWSLVITAALGISPAVLAASAQCFSVRVSGCGKKARVCVATSSSADAERKALQAFRHAYQCPSAAVLSYGNSCAETRQDPCDIRR
jgi:hypothetical protein